MTKGWGIVIALNFVVDFLLLIGTDRLSGLPGKAVRSALAAALGAIFAGMCLVPGLHFLGNLLWRVICLCLMGMTAFGFHKNALRKCCIFAVLSIALGRLALGLGGGVWMSVLAGVALCVLCLVGFRQQIGVGGYVPVELHYGDRHIKLTALHDTGNTLRDPITGRPVLVIGAEIAQQLTGLSAQQLRRPVETIGAMPGLRLIPYKTVGKENGMLLAMRLRQVKIGSWQGSALVAFAPAVLSQEGTYQALTGGMV